MAGRGLRNFRWNKEENGKEQVSLLRYFRNEGKKPLGSKSSEPTQNGSTTSPGLGYTYTRSPNPPQNKALSLKSPDQAEVNDKNLGQGTPVLDKAGLRNIRKEKPSSVYVEPVNCEENEKTSLTTLSKPVFVGPPSPEGEVVKMEQGDSNPSMGSNQVVINKMRMALDSETDSQDNSQDGIKEAGKVKQEDCGSDDTSTLSFENLKTTINKSEINQDSQDSPVFKSKQEPSENDNSGRVNIRNMKRSLSFSDNDSQDSPLVRAKGVKCARIVASSDEEEEESGKNNNINGHDDNSSNDSSDSNMPSVDDIQKFLEMWEAVYSYVPRMEFLDVYKANNWDIKETMRQLGTMNKEYKLQIRQQKLNDELERRKIASQKREEDKRKPKQPLAAAGKVIKEKIKAQSESRKAKMKTREMEPDLEEEEDDYQFGGTKVYDSDDDDEYEDDDGRVNDYDDDDPQLKNDRNLVLQFFNDGTIGELAAIGGCSKKKAEIIMNCRPFEDWPTIVSKFKTEKLITPDFLNKAKDVLHIRNTVQRLMKRCENIARDMKDIVENIIRGDEDVGINSQPELLNPEMQLKGYQLIGLNWLMLMHQQGLNGVLADEMGLGKTVQAIAFLAYIKETEAPETFSLIVVPSSTLDNWARELELWCPDMEVLQYHGSQEDRRGMRADIINNSFEEVPDIILTTYNMVTSSTEDRALFKKFRFNTLILDEAHMMKNMASQRYENLRKIKAQHRVLLTGTPLQNNLVELMSILIFVMPQLFDSKKVELKRLFSMFPKSDDSESKSLFERERIEQAKRIMKPFFLRRLKCDVLKDLPEKKDEVIRTVMSDRQRKIYDCSVASFKKRAREHQIELERLNVKDLNELEELEATVGSPKKKKTTTKDASFNIVMTLRKIANHPLLVRNHYTDKKIKDISKILKRTSHQDSVLEYIIEDFSIMSDFEIHNTCVFYPAIRKYKLSDNLILDSGKLLQLDKLLPKLKKEGARVLLFSQFVIVLNILEAYLKIRDYSYLRFDGSTQVSERQELIDQYTEDEDIFLFLLSTRAGGLGVNLTAANTVILHDIDFNPYNDKQAEDRCHRVGQTRPVKIYRLVSQDTIEESMLQIGKQKLQLERDVTGLTEDKHKKGDVLSLLKHALAMKKTTEGESSTADEAMEAQNEEDEGEDEDGEGENEDGEVENEDGEGENEDGEGENEDGEGENEDGEDEDEDGEEDENGEDDAYSE